MPDWESYIAVCDGSYIMPIGIVILLPCGRSYIIFALKLRASAI